jgi:PAS domain S-box-containing protein
VRSPEELALIASIADDLAAGIWVATVPDGRFVYANRAFDEIMGMGPVPEAGVGGYSEPYGIYTREGRLYPEDRLPFVQAREQRTTVVVDDLVIHRRDGRRVYVRASAKPMFAADGSMTHVVIAFFDITREALAERARASAEDRLQRVLGNAAIVLFTFDERGVITLCEGRGMQRIGRESKDLIGQSLFEVYIEDPNVADGARRALAGETVSNAVELPSVQASFETWLTPIRDEAGAVVGGLGVSTDVTERRRMEKQLAQAERLASVGMLAAGVAHEINNPLSYVIGNLELLARELESGGPSLVAALRDALDGAGRVRSIVRDLKVFSRVQEQHARAVDLRGPIEAAAAMAKNEIRHRAKLVLDLDPVSPVWADEGRLGQLFLNLLINAAHALPEGAAHRNEIRVVLRPAGGERVSIEVKDSGEGIPSELLPRIFDPFVSTKPAGVGTGLGLSICHSIVTDLGGRIEVESAVGEGTTFRVVLPVSTRAAGATSESRPASLGSAEPTARARVLVVDDERLILKVIAALLDDQHDVVCEARADAALARVQRGEVYDAILCDLMMPEMSGMDFYERLLEVSPKQARSMVFMTGGAFTARAREFLSRVQGRTLEKPFDEATLSARVREAVGLRSSS